ncbi:hypothetical protein C8F04DRAFT_1183801 [Mycena alexandri]|uniref:Uncharacterized protein n=1 Tax=Mycena alexandri TaxID=1745969 RepID=A0AAD6SU67_9AGAR|nr:hypothetical protein C8F04DRAFT_1183801 [Mycena alexandri]
MVQRASTSEGGDAWEAPNEAAKAPRTDGGINSGVCLIGGIGELLLAVVRLGNRESLVGMHGSLRMRLRRLPTLMVGVRGRLPMRLQRLPTTDGGSAWKAPNKAPDATGGSTWEAPYTCWECVEACVNGLGSLRGVPELSLDVCGSPCRWGLGVPGGMGTEMGHNRMSSLSNSSVLGTCKIWLPKYEFPKLSSNHVKSYNT